MQPSRIGQVEAGVRMGLLVSDVAYLLGLSRTAVYKTAAAGKVDLPPRPSRTPSLAGWQSLVAVYGTDTLKLAEATGLRKNYVKDQLERHELIECE
jgi:hypothetical protein